MTQQVSEIAVSSLTNDECFGFFNDVAHQITDSFSSAPEFCKSFLTSVTEYEAALNASKTSDENGDGLAEADRAADSAWWKLNGYLKVMTGHPKDEIREAAEALWNVFSAFENPTALGYGTEYGILERLLHALDEVPAEIISKVVAFDWIEDLRIKCQTFINKYTASVQKKATKVTGQTKQARQTVMSEYREMIKHINAALILMPIEELERFAAHLNQLIDGRKIALKSRKSRANATSAEPEVEA